MRNRNKHSEEHQGSGPSEPRKARIHNEGTQPQRAGESGRQCLALSFRRCSVKQLCQLPPLPHLYVAVKSWELVSKEHKMLREGLPYRTEAGPRGRVESQVDVRAKEQSPSMKGSKQERPSATQTSRPWSGKPGYLGLNLSSTTYCMTQFVCLASCSPCLHHELITAPSSRLVGRGE